MVRVSCILNTALRRFLYSNIKLSLLIIETEKSQKTVFLTFPSQVEIGSCNPKLELVSALFWWHSLVN